jgi:hypothetical protein
MISKATRFAGICFLLTSTIEWRPKRRHTQAQSNLARINRVTTMEELAVSPANEIRQPISGAMTDANVGRLRSVGSSGRGATFQLNLAAAIPVQT